MTMRQRPAVSVVIPHYNQNESLERCIASVACQLEGQDEIIVVDDHSAQAPSMQTEGAGLLFALSYCLKTADRERRATSAHNRRVVIISHFSTRTTQPCRIASIRNYVS
ncbi:glycosyltransferase [Ochrobactrum daejeonense]|nr:glycosyltransferase [Brucella daejeonensis]